MTAQPNQGPTTGLTPHLNIPDKRAVEAIGFYVKAFGAIEQVRVPTDDGARLMHDDFPEHTGGPMPSPSGVVLHLQVDDAAAWFKRAVAAGATPTMPPQNMFWGDRYGQLQDPFGHVWSIGSRIDEQG